MTWPAEKVMKYIFGPVMSGRLGRSLGLDLLGKKICSLDCLYCEVGPTKRLTTKREEYVKADEILAELSLWKKNASVMPDYVTLGGMGEPTLNSAMGHIITEARKIIPGVPVAILTNTTLFTDPEVRRDACLADVILPSMDSLEQDGFKKINRPHPSLDINGIRKGLLDFRSEFDGKIFLEVLLCKGINDNQTNMQGIKNFCDELAPDRVDVVTLSRPGAYEDAMAVDKDTLQNWRQALNAVCDRKSETGHGPSAHKSLANQELGQMILASLKRRPQTSADLSMALNAPEGQVEKELEGFVSQGMIICRKDGTKSFYSVDRGND